MKPWLCNITSRGEVHHLATHFDTAKGVKFSLSPAYLLSSGNNITKGEECKTMKEEGKKTTQKTPNSTIFSIIFKEKWEIVILSCILCHFQQQTPLSVHFSMDSLLSQTLRMASFPSILGCNREKSSAHPLQELSSNHLGTGVTRATSVPR